MSDPDKNVPVSPESEPASLESGEISDIDLESVGGGAIDTFMQPTGANDENTRP